MSLPVYLHSLMQGAPALAGGVNGSINALLHACLVNGFNTQSVSSATAAGGLVTFNFGSAPGFVALSTVAVDGSAVSAVNGRWRVQSAGSNQVVIAMPGVPDGAVGGTMTMRFAPLGWTRPYSGTNVAAYRQGGAAAHKRYVRVYDGSVVASQRCYVRAYESMTGVSTGTGPFPTTAEAAGNGAEWLAPFTAASTAVPWAILGTARAFYLFTGYGGDYSATPGQWPAMSPWNDIGAGFFGELDRVAKVGDTYAYGLAASYAFPGGGLYGSRASNGAAGSRPSMTMFGVGGAQQVSLGITYPDPASGGFTVHDAPIVYESFGGQYAMRGFVPGMLQSGHHAMQTNIASTTMCSVEENISGITGRLLRVCGYNLSGGEFFLKLDEDWGDL